MQRSAHTGCLSPPAVLLLCGLLRAQQLLLPGSCNFELGTCGYTSDPQYGSWSMNEEGRVAERSSETRSSVQLFGRISQSLFLFVHFSNKREKTLNVKQPV